MANTTWAHKGPDASSKLARAEEPDNRLWSHTDLASIFSFTNLSDGLKLSKHSFLLGKIRKHTHLKRLLRGSRDTLIKHLAQNLANSKYSIITVSYIAKIFLSFLKIFAQKAQEKKEQESY